jgi:hypothetical protein
MISDDWNRPPCRGTNRQHLPWIVLDPSWTFNAYLVRLVHPLVSAIREVHGDDHLTMAFRVCSKNVVRLFRES